MHLCFRTQGCSHLLRTVPGFQVVMWLPVTGVHGLDMAVDLLDNVGRGCWE